MPVVRKEIVVSASGGTRLIEVKHDMQRGLSVSRYRLVIADRVEEREFTTLRKARAAFRAQVAGPPLGAPSATGDR